MKKIIEFNIVTITTLLLLTLADFYLLLFDNGFHISIGNIIDWANQLELSLRLIVLGLLPFYIAVVVFGTATLGIYLGTKVNEIIRKITFLANRWSSN